MAALPTLPAELRMVIYQNHVLTNPYHLNHPRQTHYQGRNLAVSKVHLHEFGHTFITEYSPNKSDITTPQDFGLLADEHEKAKHNQALLNEHIFEITGYNIGDLQDWQPTLPVEDYQRVVLRVYPFNFKMFPPLLFQPPTTNPNMPPLTSFISNFTNLLSLHVCVESRTQDFDNRQFQDWFGSRSLHHSSFVLDQKSLEPITLAVHNTVKTMPSVECFVVSGRKSVGGEVMTSTCSETYWPMIEPLWPKPRHNFVVPVQTDIWVRGFRLEWVEMLEAWMENWHSRVMEERTVLARRGLGICLTCGFRRPSGQPLGWHICYS